MSDFTLLPTDYNPIFYEYLFDINRPLEILFGSGGSSKSVHAAIKAILKVRFRERNILVVRQRANSLRESFFAELKKAAYRLGLEKDFRFYDGKLLIKCLKNNASILFRGLDDVEKVKSISPEHGVIDDIIWEECTESELDAYYQLQVRQRGGGEQLTMSQISEMRYCIEKKIPWQHALDCAKENEETGKTLTLLFNPIFSTHWVKTEVFKQMGIPETIFEERYFLSDRCFCLHTTHWDNLFLTYEDHKKYEAFKDIAPYYHQVYALGRWGVLTGVIFSNWKTEDFAFSKRFSGVMMGLDFGFTNDPTVFCCVAIEGRKMYVWNEVYQTGLQNSDIARIIKPIVGRSTVRCDSSEPKSISELNLLGINSIGAKKTISKSYRLQLMSRFEIIFDVRCKNIIADAERYKWREDKYGQPMNEAEDRYDHGFDAIYYAIEDYLLEQVGDIAKMI